jgi:hypothetical protein
MTKIIIDNPPPMFGKEIKFASTVTKMGKRRMISIPLKVYDELDKVKLKHIAVKIKPILDDDGRPI